MSYVVLRDDGSGSDIDIEVNQMNEPLTYESPSANSLIVTNFPV